MAHGLTGEAPHREAGDAAALFAEAEVSAERTVALLRMAIGLSLALVFLLAVVGVTGALAEESSENLPLLQSVWRVAVTVMSSYFLLGAASYLAIRSGVYRPWMAWVAATGDVIFFVSNAWLSLVFSDMPTNYLSAMPSFWLAPLALAFGALRFNPALQLYVILLAVGAVLVVSLFGPGWVLSSADSAPEALPFFFAIPPNVMRLAMLTLAGGVLVIAALRARALLRRAVRETRARANLTRYLPRAIADRAAASGLDAVRRGEHRVIAVLFTDMRGFTQLSQSMSAEEISEFVSEHRRRIVRAVSETGGEIDKFIGDAALAVFGLTRETPANAAAALDCAERVIDEMRAWSAERVAAGLAPVSCGVGVHYGDAFCGAIGDDSRLEFTVLGDTVNVASRLEALTKEMGETLTTPLLVSEHAYEAAGGATARPGWRDIEAATLRGRDHPIALYTPA